MTRDEIDELIEYLEKNYCVKCDFVEATHDLEYDQLNVTSTMSYHFNTFSLNKEHIINVIDKLDLIRF